MEKSNSLFNVRNIIIVLFFSISCYFAIANIRDKGTISRLENAIEAERDIAVGIEYTNRELRQNINQLYRINSGLEKTIRNLGRTEQGFEDANNQFGKGLEELRRISEGFKGTNKNSREGIEKIENILDNLENTSSSSNSNSGL